MSRVAPLSASAGRGLPRWLIYVFVLGLYLSLRGYHSFDGDQSYRLPLLLHQQDPSVYSDDPFVRAFDAFNPHRGSLVALDVVTRTFGLSAGLFLTFVLTFGVTCLAFDRLARAIWPEAGPRVGLVAVGLLLTAKAGNIGTNHLFEAMVLDRLMAFALGWMALAAMIIDPSRGRWRAAFAIALATLIHPSVGLQLSFVIAASWMAWCVLGRWSEVNATMALQGILGLALSVLPGLAINVSGGSSLLGTMPPDVFWLLSVELQGPQHMLPHLWRMPQWLAWGCYLVLAALALTRPIRPRNSDARSSPVPLASHVDWPAARARLVVVLTVILVGLAMAWCAIERFHLVRIAVFQPFRMATVARGIALVLIAGRVEALWRRRDWLGRLRAILLAVAFVGDWLLVVVALAELVVSITEAVGLRWPWPKGRRLVERLAFAMTLALGLNFLAHHDTEYGNRTLLATLALASVIVAIGHGKKAVSPRLSGAAVALAWFIPLAALLAAAVPVEHAASRHPLIRALISRCRFAAVPADDIERLGFWCRDHTPPNARFIGPPGPKTFRLWSRRSLAFNRAASPYHADGLADWLARFQDHLDFHGSPAAFARSYINDRHGFESRYQAQSDADRAALALRQGATYVIAAAPSGHGHHQSPTRQPLAPLTLLRVEGRYAVYCVNPELLAQRQR